MAFFNKAGSILRQAVSKQHINHEISASNPSIFQLIRCMSSKLFVGGISWNTNDNSLQEAFSKYGEVIEGLCSLKLYVIFEYRSPLSCLYIEVLCHACIKFTNFHLESLQLKLDFCRCYARMESAPILCLKEGLSDGVTIVVLIGLIKKVVAFLVGFTRVIYDRESGRSRGFGFVTFSGSEDASAAIQALDGQELDGRRIRVNIANDRTRGYSGGGGGFGGGGYGGGGNYGSGGYGSGGGNYGSGGYGGGGGNYGASGYGGSGNYGGAGGVDANGAGNYGSGENSFGFASSGGNNFSSGDSHASGSTDAASNSFASSFSSSDQLGNDAGSNQAEIGDVNSPVDAGENSGDDNVESSDYAERRS